VVALSANLLRALALISEMYRGGKRTLASKAAYRIHSPSLAAACGQGWPYRRPAYELCVFSDSILNDAQRQFMRIV
jgi:hypothetical protein